MRNDVVSCADIKKVYEESLASKSDEILHRELPAILSVCRRAAEQLEREVLVQFDCGSEVLRYAVFDKLATELKDLGFTHSQDMNDGDCDHPSILMVRISGWK